MRNIIYCAQFHDKTGYSVAALGYLKSVSENFPSETNFKIYSVSVGSEDFPEAHLSFEEKALIDKYHIKDDNDLEKFMSQGYDCIWHMTTALPFIAKNRDIFYKNCSYNLYDLIRRSERNYHIVVWETDNLPMEWKEGINHLRPEKLITASKWNADCFSKIKEVALVPHLIEESPTKKAENFRGLDLTNKFVIFSLSEWNRRKNHEHLISSFISELGDKEDVLFILKTSPSHEADKEGITNAIKSIKNSIRIENKKNNIVLILDYLDDLDLQYWYDRCDVFALLSRGEGFSLPIAEAIKAKKPVIVPKEGGHIDYISPNNAFFVEGHWDTVFGPAPYDIDGKWYIPSIDSTRKKLRQAYEMWKYDQESLKVMGEENSKFLKDRGFDRNSVGEKFINALERDSVSFSLPKKEKIHHLKMALKKKPLLEDKVNILKDSFKGEDCYILNCGPSLNQHSKEFMNEFLKDKLVLSMKQTYNSFTEVTDFHFFNCSNLPITDDKYLKRHYNYNNEVISVASSNYEQGHRWSRYQDTDLFFKIPIRTEINNEFLVRTKEIDENLLSNKTERPCGPGIMLETGLFMAFHLGVKNIYSIGWDLTSKKVNEDTYPHFYGNTKEMMNRGDIMSWEIEEARHFTKDIYNWCKKNEIGFYICSEPSALYEEIPRINLRK